MIFKQLFDQKSSTYTYLIASSKGREALIIDPVLENVSNYIILLKELDLRLVKVIDTHIHADHITALNELNKRTSCTRIMGENSKSEVIDLKNELRKSKEAQRKLKVSFEASERSRVKLKRILRQTNVVLDL